MLNRFDYTLLQSFMASKGYTAESMAARIGITKGGLQDRLSNKASFSLDEVRKIAQILELDAESVNACFFTE